QRLKATEQLSAIPATMELPGDVSSVVRANVYPTMDMPHEAGVTDAPETVVRAAAADSPLPVLPRLTNEPAPRRTPSDMPTVPGYEVLDVLGRGGMGVVYKARHLRLNRLVALKMILAGAHASPHDLARFELEAETLAALHHPNIVQVYESGEINGCPY